MKSDKTTFNKLCENLDSRLKEFKKPKTAHDFISSALALSKTIVYKLEFSWGGPADGFKIFVDPDTQGILDIIYYFADWFEYQEKYLTNDEIDLVQPYIKPLIEV